MSASWQLQTPCGVITAIWSHICATPAGEIEHLKLAKQLTKSLQLGKLELAERHIQTALKDQLIDVCIRPKQRGRQRTNPNYTFPKRQTVSDEQPDKCCYECHNTGNVTKCDGCMRSFHESCIKSPEDKVHELRQFVTKEKRFIISASERKPTRLERRRNSIVSVATLDESIDWPVELQLYDDDSVEDEQNSGVDIKLEPINLDSSHNTIKLENDIKEDMLTDEPMFIGTVRPPNRRLQRMLNTSTIKPEESSDADDISSQANENDVLMRRRCYACQVLQNGNNVSPNIGTKELNYLLSFGVEQYKSWLPKDTFSPSKLFKDKLPRTVLAGKVIAICKKMLLRTPTSLADVQAKIANEQYTSIEEFHVDLLDIAHNIGIIYGVNSLDYSAAMYFLADCAYELREIRQCSDCYRHSSEKVAPDWFTRPCRTRHELVFAKLKSYQYWPAKVVRVTNDQYDVRFFGDKHPRGLINANCVRPIDTDLRTLRVNTKHRGFQQAMDEMLQYQSLSEGIREQYSFSSVQQTMESAVPAVQCESRAGNSGKPSGPVTRKRNNPRQQPSTPVTSESARQQKHRKLLDRLTHPVELRAKALQLLQETEDQFTRKLEQLSENHRQEVSDIKKKQWCAMCEKEARIQCCWNTFYCAAPCQKSHWVQHEKRHQAGGRYHRLRSVSVCPPTQQDR